MDEIENQLESSSDGARMVEFRRSTLRKMLDYPQILSELIIERLSMDLLIKLAPVVLENKEEGDGKFDDLLSPLFCRSFLNSHYESDTILQLVGKELEAVKKGKPDRLSVMALSSAQAISIRVSFQNLDTDLGELVQW